MFHFALLLTALAYAQGESVTARLHDGRQFECTLGYEHPMLFTQPEFYACRTPQGPVLLKNEGGVWTAIGLTKSGSGIEELPLQEVSKDGVVQFVTGMKPPEKGAFQNLSLLHALNFEFKKHPRPGEIDAMKEVRAKFGQAISLEFERLKSIAQNETEFVVELEGGEKMRCTRGKDAARAMPGCELYACVTTTPSGKPFEGLLYINRFEQSGFHLGVFPLLHLTTKEGFGPDPGDFRVKSTSGELLIGNRLPTNNPFAFSIPETHLPSQLIPSKNTLTHFYVPGWSDAQKQLAAACDSPEIRRLFEQEEQAFQKARQQIARTEVVQLVHWINGAFYSEAIPKSGLPPGVCSIDGIYLTTEANKNLNEFLGPGKTYPYTIVSPQEAEEIYRQVSAMSDIAFDYAQDGCYARAHLVGERLAKQGIEVEKIWVSGSLKPESRPDIEWIFHVAPVIHVRVGDKVERRVIDPSIAKELLTPEEWVRRTQPKPLAGSQNVQFPLPRNIGFYERQAVGYSARSQYMPWSIENSDPVKEMKNAEETNARYIKYLKQKAEAAAHAHP